MRWQAALWACVVLASSPARTQDFRSTSFQKSSSHARLVLAPRPGSHGVLQVRFRAGSIDEGDLSGITRLAQHALLEANRRGGYEALAIRLFQAATSVQMETDLKSSTFTLTAHQRDFDALAAEVLQRVLCPDLDRARFPEAVERTLQDDRLLSDTSPLHRLLTAVLMEDWRYRSVTTGTRDAVESLSFEEVERYLFDFLSPSNATVVVAGAFDERRLKAAVSVCEGGISRGSLRPTLELPYQTALRWPRVTNIIAHPLTVKTPRESAALRLLASLADERLKQRFRHQGIAYSVEVEVLLSPPLDALVLFLPAREAAGLDLMLPLREELARLREEPLSAEELDTHRQRTLRALREADAQAQQVVHELMLAELRPGWYGPEMVAELESLSLDAFKEALLQWTTPETRVELRLGPHVQEPEGRSP